MNCIISLIIILIWFGIGIIAEIFDKKLSVNYPAIFFFGFIPFIPWIIIFFR